ncbi:MAG: RNA polymerase sigma factor [Polyangiaceae bacterium]
MQPATELTDPDRVLSERARLGVRGAFDALVVRYQARAYRLAWRMTGNRSDAEEIVQEAFLRAHRAMGTFHGDSRFGTWLYRIVVNEALMRKRAAARRPTQSLDEPLRGADGDWSIGAEHLLEQKRVTQLVRDALDTLDGAQRAALVLRDLEGLSSEEAGEILGVQPETVRQRAHRARLKLRGLLGHLADAA